MGSIAKGKVNASEATEGMRIIVKVSYDAEGHATIRPSSTKTGEGVFVARIIEKGFRAAGRYEARGKYVVHTSAGSFDAAPIQTMWLAPEDAAGIKRAHAEALAENEARTVAEAVELAEVVAEELKAADEAGTISTQKFQELTRTYDAAIRCTRRSYGQPTAGRLALRHLADIQAEIASAVQLTLHSQAVKVGPDSEDNPEEPEMTAETQTAVAENHTGSAVVMTLEKVWARIREDHPELPEVVIITGSGLLGGSKWGHFRAEGWKIREEGAALKRHELFLAGEALAKGARQVLQTMLHEAAHTLAKVRGQQDTSRQGRWHNATFRKTAEEMGLEHRASTADKSHGFSFVTLTTETAERYADLLAELDREIRLVCHLPLWLGGETDEDDRGGEKITGKAPEVDGETKPRSGPLKATCRCEEPIIIRLSQKVLDMGVVRCDDCENLFTAA
jgi:hypothetical protein